MQLTKVKKRTQSVRKSSFPFKTDITTTYSPKYCDVIGMCYLFLLSDVGWDTADVTYSTLFSVPIAVCINLIMSSLLNLHKVPADKTIHLHHSTVLAADYVPSTTNPQLFHLTDTQLCAA
jgi:hypothetical protein